MTDTVIIKTPNQGAPEGHEAAMIAKADAAAGVQTSDRPDWLPEKFATVEDMAKAYGELESKLGQKPATETTEPTPPVTPPKADDATAPDAAAEALKGKGLDMAEFSAEFDKTGELSQESYDKLLAQGFDKNLVDNYIEGRKAVAANYDNEVFTAAGGKDGYVELVQWAAQNLSAAQQDAYNEAVSSGNVEKARLAVSGLQAQFTKANGSEPNLLGGNVRGNTVDVFESTAQVTAAMKDSRYQNDAAYRNAVQQKLARSNVF